MSADRYDAVVIGAGPAGEVVAGRLAKQGLNVAIVEEHLVAGECSYYACMPSKALLRPQQALDEARRVAGAAQAVTGSLDVRAVLERRDEVIHELDDESYLGWLDALDITLVRGRGRLTGERRVTVTSKDGGETELVAERAIVLATGTTPSIPPIDGLREAAPWTNREATTTSELPDRVLILGTGPVGTELSDAYSAMGVRVTTLEQGDRMLGKEEPFASEQVQGVLEDRGVDIRLDAELTKVERAEPGGVCTVHLKGSDGNEEQLEVDEIIVAAGRRPNTGDLGLDAVGVEPNDHGFVDVDRTLRVPGHDWLYALGDVNGRDLLTHQGKYQAHIAAQVIMGRRGAEVRDGGAPPVRVTFCTPQVAAVGHTAKTAEDAGLDVRCVDVPTDSTAGSSFVGKGVPGTCRLVVDETTGRIVGATFTGHEMSEQIHAATIAITAGVQMQDLWEAVPAFPSRSEIWLRLLEAYEGW